MSRFFVPKENIGEKEIIIDGPDARHIARALRMAAGDEVTVCDTDANVYSCRLTKIRDEECICEILGTGAAFGEPAVDITLFMGYPKGDKLEFVIQKATELGVSKIVPFESSRCIKKPKAEKADKKDARFSRIAEEAAKQCGRCKIPEVCAPVTFKKAVESAALCDLRLFCYEGEGKFSLKDAINANKNFSSVSVMVGCEGGFSPDEADYAINAGLLSVGLGKRILRCETAPIYVLSALSYHLEL